RVRIAGVHHPLALPHETADVDDLARAGQRLVERHTVPTLDYLRTRRAEPEHEPAVGYRIKTCSCHGRQCRCARVNRQDAGRQFCAVSGGGEVAEDGDGVEAVELGDPQHIDPRGLEVSRSPCRALNIARVSDRGRELHPNILPPANSWLWLR